MDVPTEFLKKHLPACGNIIIADGREFVLKEIKGAKAYVYSNTQNYSRLLCFYRLKTDQGLLLERDQRLKSFGSHFCLVDSKKFIQRVDNYAKANNLFFSPVYVKYATEAYRGAYNPTFKGDAFSYQNEFRFILRGESLNKLHSVLAIGETVAVEFKRCGNGIESDTYETVCSFLNRFGGDIFMGILDDGTVLGVPEKAAPPIW